MKEETKEKKEEMRPKETPIHHLKVIRPRKTTPMQGQQDKETHKETLIQNLQEIRPRKMIPMQSRQEEQDQTVVMVRIK